jgi:hypothetical protein
MTQQKNIWELQHTTICKVVGMALDFDDLKKVGRKFHLIFKETCVDEEFALHSAIVGICDKDSKISRHVQKLIEERFRRYMKRLSQRDAGEITELVLNEAQTAGIPLWAILWHLATSRVVEGDRVETALFGHFHMLEHKLLKDFWNASGGDRDGQENQRKEEIDSLRRELITLRSSNIKLEKENQRLAQRLAQSSQRPAFSSPTSASQGENSAQDKKIERLKLLLEASREKNRELEEECSQSRTQIEALTRELFLLESANLGANEKAESDPCSCPLKHCLRGKRIAMVGGIDSLERHYRSLVEHSGGEFCRHDGKCCRGERKLEECIRHADLVVCPVSVNSHFGAIGVKKVCRRYGIACCFPDSSGLASLRSTLLQHFTPDQEIPRDSASNGLE